MDHRTEGKDRCNPAVVQVVQRERENRSAARLVEVGGVVGFAKQIAEEVDTSLRLVALVADSLAAAFLAGHRIEVAVVEEGTLAVEVGLGIVAGTEVETWRIQEGLRSPGGL